LKISIFGLTQCTNVTDTHTHTQTHRHTDTPYDGIGLCIVFRGKNVQRRFSGYPVIGEHPLLL